jgi:cysteinyl-tRNA synthetase
MAEPPEEVRRLAEERAARRAERDFAAADALRDRLAELGWSVVDEPEGSRLQPLAPPEGIPRRPLRPGDVQSVLDDPPSADASVHWISEGWPEDVLRGITSVGRHAGPRSVQHVVVDVAGADPTGWPRDVEVWSLEPGTGWAAARNAGLRRSRGRIVVVVDGSVEAVGDVLDPLEEALADPSIGICGPYGIVTEDLRSFRESPGPDVDAIEGYLMAFRRELLQAGLAFDERFRFYRTADIELSFRVKERGLRAVVVPVPVVRHEHRVWTHTPPGERERLSKRNFYRFLERFRGRFDLTVRGRPPEGRTR